MLRSKLEPPVGFTVPWLPKSHPSNLDLFNLKPY